MIAAMIGVTKQPVTNWFSGRQQSTTEPILTIQEFLGKQHGS
jgi:hypothetical protein